MENSTLRMLRKTAKTFSPYVFALIYLLSGYDTTVAQSIIIQDGVTVSECSGIFYDSGGPSANYSNSESLTMTICPVGGAGSGPRARGRTQRPAADRLPGRNLGHDGRAPLPGAGHHGRRHCRRGGAARLRPPRPYPAWCPASGTLRSAMR